MVIIAFYMGKIKCICKIIMNDENKHDLIESIKLRLEEQ